MEKLSLKEFEKKYMKGVTRWDFDKFSIVCKKCSSLKVEYNNTMAVGKGYYDDIETHGGLVVKCHDCGNAFKLDTYDIVKP